MNAFLSHLNDTGLTFVLLEVLGGIAFVMVIISIPYYVFGRRLSPGPPGLPLTGNLFAMPKSHPWLTHTRMHKKYGPIFSIQYSFSTVIYIGTYDVARELQEKRSNIYSSRLRMVMDWRVHQQG